MNTNIITIILALIIGIIIGAIVIIVIEYIRVNNATKKAEKLLQDAKRGRQHKRDVLLEIKEESFKLKSEAEKEIKQKKRK